MRPAAILRSRHRSIFMYFSGLLALSGCGEDPTTSVPQIPSRELIDNGSFETPAVLDTSIASSAFLTYSSLSSAVTGWTVARVDVVHRKLWPAASGNQSIDLNGASAGMLARRLDTKAGESYVLSFSYGTNPVSDLPASPETRRIRILWNQAVVETVSVDRVSPIVWHRHATTLAARGDDSLQIESISGGRTGVALDSISLLGP